MYNSLGLLLHFVAEEKLRDIHLMVWRDGSTCTRYRKIVNRCLVSDPKARSSAVEVLSLLEKGSGP
jgi:hypothetical protein